MIACMNQHTDSLEESYLLWEGEPMVKVGGVTGSPGYTFGEAWEAYLDGRYVDPKNYVLVGSVTLGIFDIWRVVGQGRTIHE